MPKIKTDVRADGSRRYRFTADVGKHPDGRRRQQTFTFNRKKDAERELARIGHLRPRGEYVAKWNGTVDQLCDEYERSATFGREANTAESYKNALKPARARLGHRRAVSVTRQDIENVRDWMMTEGRRRGGTPGTGLGPRSVRLTIGRLSAAFEQAVDDGKLARNPCRKVRLPSLAKRTERWSEDEAKAFLAVANADRLAAAWRLTMYGMRRGEVTGLRWEDVDLAARTLRVGPTRVVINGHPLDKASPKSERGARVLPLDDKLAELLHSLRDLQDCEAIEAGPAYAASGHVVCDETGAAVNPEWYSDEFHRLRKRAGVREISLHDCRRTANSLMAAAGVPGHIRASWCGHRVEVNEASYTTARPEDLGAAGAALSKILNGDVTNR
jgi:integrase